MVAVLVAHSHSRRSGALPPVLGRLGADDHSHDDLDEPLVLRDCCRSVLRCELAYLSMESKPPLRWRQAGFR